MHQTIFCILLLAFQSVSGDKPQDTTDQLAPASNSQTLRKPTIQDSPPSSFIPPKPSSSSFNPGGATANKSKPPRIPKSNSFQESSGFKAPSSGAQPADLKLSSGKPTDKTPTSKPPASLKLQDSKTSAGNFSSVNPAQTKPLRSSQTPSIRPRETPQAQLGDGKETRSIGVRSLGDSGTPERLSSPTIQPQANLSPSLGEQKSNGLDSRFGRSAGGLSDGAAPSNTQELRNPSSAPPQFSQPSSIRNPRKQLDPGRQYGSQTTPDRRPKSAQLNQPVAQPQAPPSSIIKDETFDPQLKQIADLILTSLQRPAANRLSLAQAVSKASGSSQRKAIVKQYWTCFVTAADLQFAEQELQLLSSMPSPTSQVDQLLLRAASSTARARLAETKIAYAKSAKKLYQLSPTFDPAKTISFADLPWIGKYKTNSDQFVKTGMFDPKIRQVDSALPAIRDLIYLRGAAVYDNLNALQQSIPGLSNGKIQLETVLKLHQETRNQRIEFLTNIEKYNHAIADYAISVFPQAGQPLVVARMLVDTEKTLPDETIMDPKVRQASGNQSPTR